MEKKKLSKSVKMILRGAPLAGIIVTDFLPLHRLGQQFLMLIVLIWLQVFD